MTSSQPLHQTGWIGRVLLGIYFIFVIGIGLIWRKAKHERAFFESGRSLPAWICALGFIGCKCVAQKVMGMAAAGAKHGIATSHFHWIVAISTMAFVGVFMMPFYYGLAARFRFAGLPFFNDARKSY